MAKSQRNQEHLKTLSICFSVPGFVFGKDGSTVYNKRAFRTKNKKEGSTFGATVFFYTKMFLTFSCSEDIALALIERNAHSHTKSKLLFVVESESVTYYTFSEEACTRNQMP